MPDLYGSTDYSLTEIAERVEGVAKAKLPALSMEALVSSQAASSGSARCSTRSSPAIRLSGSP